MRVPLQRFRRTTLAVLVGWLLIGGTVLGEDPPEDPTSSLTGFPIDKTRLTDFESVELPTARNFWALLQNQVPGVVTDRDDVGGLRGDTPARFGGFGSSWTQNTVLLNGLDLTDRYSGERPALFPDLDAFEAVDVSTAVHPASIGRPGIAIALVPRRGGDTFHGGVALFGQGDRTQSDNVTEGKRALGVTSSERFGSFGSGSVHAGGPLAGGRGNFFAAVSRTAFTKTPQNAADSASSMLETTLVNLNADLGRHRTQLLWAGDWLSNPRAGLSARIPVSATQDESESFHAVQLSDAFDLEQGLTLTSQAGVVWSVQDRRQQEGITQQSGLELFEGTRTGVARFATHATRQLLAFSETLEGRSRVDRLFGLALPARVSWQAALSWDELVATNSWSARDSIELHYFEGRPFSTALWNTPTRTRDRARNVTLLVQGRAALAALATVDAGLSLRASRAWLPGGDAPAISWTSLSPRLLVSVPIGRRFVLRAGYSRYFHQLLANLLDFEDPKALGGRTVRWNDLNGDDQFQPGEEGQTLRVFGGPVSRVDPNLKPPTTNELTLGLSFAGRDLDLEMTAIQRYEKRLIGLVNTGVPFSSYVPVTVHDDGSVAEPGPGDGPAYVVYEQRPETLGKDSFLLTNPPGFRSFYQGVSIVLRLRSRNRPIYGAFSATAFRIVGMASQKGESQEYDPGVVGDLFTDPNTLINADGRLFFDRAFIVKLAAGCRLPWRMSLGAVAKYWDGLPFGRKLIVADLSQGPFYIFATPRGNGLWTSNEGHRTEYDLTLDLSLEKRLAVGGASLGIRLDVFNALNANLNTRENDLSAPDFSLRRPLENLAPRVFRIGMKYDF
jgi:hypothetical protein